MAYTSWSVVYGEQPSAAKWNILGTNDASFNDGTGIGTNAISGASLSTTAINIGYAEKTSSQGSITTEVLVSSLSVTFTVPAGGRRVLTEVYGAISNTGTATHTVNLRLNNLAGAIQATKSVFNASATAQEDVNLRWSSPTSAGTYTYVVTATAPSGTATWLGSATARSYIQVTLQ